jgi:hypothetical protein
LNAYLAVVAVGLGESSLLERQFLEERAEVLAGMPAQQSMHRNLPILVTQSRLVAAALGGLELL